MDVHDFNYDLPPELIAQEPVTPRDISRLMVLKKTTGEIEHGIFRDLLGYLQAPDILVLNETRVRSARLRGQRANTGGQVEVLLLRPLDGTRWEALVRPGRRLRPGSEVLLGGGKLTARVEAVTPAGTYIISLSEAGDIENLIEEVGEVPLPPYIKKRLDDPARYQTVYATERGSAAAPTAGLHFTPELLQLLTERGVQVVRVILHVGIDTFRPVRVARVEEHQMHSEYYRVSPEAAERINAARAAGGRIIAVGTTVVRTLESCASAAGEVQAAQGETRLFIYPGYRFRVVDGLVTNFHLPRSTLLMLVSAFAGREQVLHAYRVAVQERYRFYSFGDAMLII